MVIRIDRPMTGFPGSIRDWPLGNHADLFFVRQGQGEVDCFLVRNIDRSLQRIEHAAFDCKFRRVTVATVTDVTRVAFFARGLQRVDRFALP